MNAWVLAARPKTLAAGVVPVLVGGAVVHDAASPVVWSLCLVCTILIQIGTNLFNDYYDFARGADTAERLGPVRVTQAGLIAPGVVLRAGILCFVGAMIAGLVVAALAGWELAALGAVCLLCGWLYTGGPFPLAYLGLGEVFVFVFFGLIATAGTAYAAGGGGVVDVDAVVAGAGVGFVSCCLILVNNLRDVDGDAKANKRTIAVRFGRSFARACYVFCAVASFACAFLVSGFFVALAIPFAVKNVVDVLKLDGRALNPLLGGTARWLAVYGLTLSLSLVVLS